jgi:hypothetical protein
MFARWDDGLDVFIAGNGFWFTMENGVKGSHRLQFIKSVIVY